jgi:hypothetical protein
MMTDKEIMQQTLNTLENLFWKAEHPGGVAVWRLGGSYEVKEAIDALKARLEQPEDVTEINFGNIADEPCRSPYCECDSGKCTHLGFYDARAAAMSVAWVGLTDKEINCVVETSKNVEGSLVLPYGYARDIEAKLKEKNGIPEAYSILCKAIEKEKKQPAREWVGLTPEDYDSMRPRVPYIVSDFTFADVAAIVEAKLKEKNK